MTVRTLRITSTEGFATLERYLKFGGQAPFRLILAVPGWPADMRAEAERTLSHTLSACGCTEGAVGLLVAMPVGVAAASALLPTAAGTLVWVAGIGASAVAGALVGKLIGLLRARRRLTAEIARFLAAASLAATG